MDEAYFDDIPFILKDFLSYMETIRGKSKNTIQEYYYDLRLFLRFLKIHKGLEQPGKEPGEIHIKNMDTNILKEVTLSDLYSFMSFLSRERDNSSSSRARKVASIRSFFNYITNKAKILDHNPALELESPKIMKRLPRYLNIEESKRLLAAIEGVHKERDFAIIMLFLNCGLRLSELVDININRIKNNILTILGKGNKERTIYLNEACQKAIEEYLKVRSVDGVKDKNALFLSSRKQRISSKTVQYIVKKHIKAAGLDPERYSAHKLRHTAATLMYKHGKVDIRALQEILGHESISTTEIYTHLDSQQIKNAVESNPLSNYFEEKDDNTKD